MPGQHDAACRVAVRRELGQHREAVHTGHLHVEDHHVRPVLGHRAECLGAVGDIGDHRQVRLQAEQRGHGLPGQPLVVGEHDGDHASTAANRERARPLPRTGGELATRRRDPAGQPGEPGAVARRPAPVDAVVHHGQRGRPDRDPAPRGCRRAAAGWSRPPAAPGRTARCARSSAASTSTSQSMPAEASSVRAPVSSVVEVGPAAAARQLTHVPQRTAGQPLHLDHLGVRPFRVDRHDAGRQLALQRHHLQRVAEDVVQVLGEPQPLAGRAELGGVAAGLVQLDARRATAAAPPPPRSGMKTRMNTVMMASGNGSPGTVGTSSVTAATSPPTPAASSTVSRHATAERAAVLQLGERGGGQERPHRVAEVGEAVRARPSARPTPRTSTPTAATAVPRPASRWPAPPGASAP